MLNPLQINHQTGSGISRLNTTLLPLLVLVVTCPFLASFCIVHTHAKRLRLVRPRDQGNNLFILCPLTPALIWDLNSGPSAPPSSCPLTAKSVSATEDYLSSAWNLPKGTNTERKAKLTNSPLTPSLSLSLLQSQSQFVRRVCTWVRNLSFGEKHPGQTWEVRRSTFNTAQLHQIALWLF